MLRSCLVSIPATGNDANLEFLSSVWTRSSRGFGHSQTQTNRLRQCQMDLAFFRSFFVDNEGLSSPLKTTPATFDENSPVFVVEMGHKDAGELLGVSKVKGGNRMATAYLATMCVVFRLAEENSTMWLTV